MAGLERAGQDRLVSVSQGGSNYRVLVYCTARHTVMWWQVCYSSHASLAELQAVVRYLAPLQITPCAIPPNSSREEVRPVESPLNEVLASL